MLDSQGESPFPHSPADMSKLSEDRRAHRCLVLAFHQKPSLDEVIEDVVAEPSGPWASTWKRRVDETHIEPQSHKGHRVIGLCSHSPCSVSLGYFEPCRSRVWQRNACAQGVRPSQGGGAPPIWTPCHVRRRAGGLLQGAERQRGDGPLPSALERLGHRRGPDRRGSRTTCLHCPPEQGW